MPIWGQAAQRIVGDNGANTSYVGQRNTFFIPGKGYWSFFKATNPDSSVWRFSVDGLDWKATNEAGAWVDKADVFPFLALAPDAAWGNPSVWLSTGIVNAAGVVTDRVYVVASDAAADVLGGGATARGNMNDTTGNKVFLRWGTLNGDGSITWNPAGIRRQKMAVRFTDDCQNETNANRNNFYDPLPQRTANHGVVFNQ